MVLSARSPLLCTINQQKKMSIRVVDYQDYKSEDLQKRQQFIQNLGHSFSEIGFAIVSNHGVSEELKAKLFDLVDRYFQQSEDLKNQGIV